MAVEEENIGVLLSLMKMGHMFLENGDIVTLSYVL